MAEQNEEGNTPIAVHTSDEDSAYGDDMTDYAVSLSSSVQNYQWEHGRRYHSFREGVYQFPNDEREQDRLDMVHHMFRLAMNDKLHFAPLPPDPARILDVGTGTGIWAMEMDWKRPQPNSAPMVNSSFPACRKSGNNADRVPPNVIFEVDDCESEWPNREPFDFIHSRYMAGSISDWPRYMRQAYEQTKEGGWVEFQDFDLNNYSEDNSIGADNQVMELYRLLIEACDKAGRGCCPGRDLKKWVEEAGFKNVHHEVIRLPVGPWAKDMRLRQVGAFNLLQLLDGLEAFAIGPFTRMLDWSPERVQTFLVGVREDAKLKSVHMMHELHVVYGQKLSY
ncbi:MAG: hypothetical protein M1834_008420 [Cirrosporium novae-zelandiae]|nr:MAG: hypothetical protein M1834_008420 [Cirrosporium novae-zelandiae]